MSAYFRSRKGKEQKREQAMQQRLAAKLMPYDKEQLQPELAHNLDELERVFGQSNDLVIRRFQFQMQSALYHGALVFIDGLVSSQILDEHILRSLMIGRTGDAQAAAKPHAPQQVIDYIKNWKMPVSESKSTTQLRDLIRSVLAGDTGLLVDGCSEALLLNTKGWERRGVEEPRSESVVRGPRDAFTETLRVNTALIRRRIKDPDLRIRNLTLGARSNTDVAMVWIDGVADPVVVEEVERRIQAIEVDGLMDGGYVEQFIEDSHWSPFPLIQNTERPDKASGNLLEGKVVIIVDGSPQVLIAPSVFSQFYHSPEDYYERFLISTLVRFIRALSMTMALLLPSFYISFSSFHPEMIPSKLVIAMAAGRATVPFPSVIEAFAMEVSIEILREASVRLPGPIGPTIGIVGALIVGEAAVRAGIVSPIMVIVVSLTTIGSFAAPSYNAAIALRMLRFPVMLLAAMFGLYGIMLFMIVIVIHLCSLKSFGVPYLAPFTPRNFLELGDSVIRIPLYRMKKRPNVFVRKAERYRINPTSAEDVTSNGKRSESDESDESDAKRT